MFRAQRLLVLAALLFCPLMLACADPEVQKQQYLKDGDSHMAAGRYQDAVIQFRNAVRLDAKSGQARFKLAAAFEKAENLEAAFREYIRAADLLPDDRAVQLKAAQVLLAVGRYEDAKTRAAALIKKDDRDMDAILLHANAIAGLKDPAGALKQIEDALKIRPDSASGYLHLGVIQAASGNTKEAEAALRTAVNLSPNSPDAHVAMASFLWSTRGSNEAETALQEALRIAPDHVLANRMLAVLYMITGRNDKAEAPLKRVVEGTKTDSSRLILADYYVENGRADEATKVLAEIKPDGPMASAAELRRARVDYVGQQRERAHQRLDELLQRYPNSAEALVTKAQWLAGENKLDEALVRAKAAVAADGASAAAYYVLGDIHKRRRDPAEARKAYQDVLRVNPSAFQAQLELAHLSLSFGDTDSALNYAQQAKQTKPTSGAARVSVAYSLLARRDLAGAEAEIAVLKKNAPTEAAVHAVDGSLQALRGDVPAARRAYEHALELSPDLMEPVFGLAELDLRAKQYQHAAARVEAALGKRPDDPELLALASRVYKSMGDAAKAEQALRRAVTVDPRFMMGYTKLAELYMSQNRLDDARLEFETIARTDPSALGAKTLVGVLLEVQNKPQEARRWYEDTVAQSGRAPIAANNLAYMYAEEGTKLDQALQLAQAAKADLPEMPEIDDTLGWVYYKQGLTTMAVDSFKRSVERDPTKAIYHYHLGLAYAKVGDSAKARTAFQQALKLEPDFAKASEVRQTLSSLER